VTQIPSTAPDESLAARLSRVRADWGLGERLLYLFCRRPPERLPPPPGGGSTWARHPYRPGERVGPLLAHLPSVGPETFAGARVVDFGSGAGQLAFDLAPLAREVIGLEIRDEMIAVASAKAAELGLSNVHFEHSERIDPDALGADLVVSTDAFEHFEDPGGILALCARLLRPGGRFLITFGPPWAHPVGHHLGFMCAIPWFHLLASEKVMMNVRRLYRSDEARTFAESSGGLGRLTVGGFLRHVRRSGFEVESLRLEAIWGLRPLVWLPGLRELFTSLVSCVLRRPG